MTAHRLFRQSAAALRDELPLFETDRLFVETGIPYDSGRDLGIVGLDDADAIFREVLIADMESIAVNHCLDHWRVQKA